MLPEDVEQIRVRPVWQLSTAEEKRTKYVEVQFEPSGSERDVAETRPVAKPPPSTPSRSAGPQSGRLVRLLDRASTAPLWLLILLAFGLGAAHSIQPGHGKSRRPCSRTEVARGPSSRPAGKARSASNGTWDR